jgi:hypothetical protein
MKIRTAAVTAVLIGWVAGFASPAAAQDQLGVLVGLNSANVEFDVEGTSVSLDRRNGFAGGVYWVRALGEAGGVEVDALIAQKGTSISGDLFGSDMSIKLTYLDIPVLARFNGAATPTVGFQAYAGPSFNFKLSESFELEGVDFESEDEVKSFEMAVVLGGGVSFGRIRVDARYGLGLTSLADEDELGIDGSAKNRVFSILFGIALR